MVGFALAVAIFCSSAVALTLLTIDLRKLSWMVGPDKHRHPNAYWALIGGHALIAAIAWLYVGGVI